MLFRSVDPVLNQNYLNEMIENYVPQAKKVQMEAVKPLQAAGTLQEGNTIRAAGTLQEGNTLQTADTLREANALQEGNIIRAADTLQEGNILQAANTLQTAGTEKQKPGDKSANKVFEEIFDTEYLRNPEISPLFGDFTGFPPTYIQVGDLEVLMSDSTMLQKKMSGEGVAVSLDTYKNMWHVFQMGPFKTAVEAIHKCGEFIYSVQ